MQMPGIPQNSTTLLRQTVSGNYPYRFWHENMNLVNEKLNELKKDGFKILRGPRKTGDGYWEFETLDPDNNRIEVSAIFIVYCPPAP